MNAQSAATTDRGFEDGISLLAGYVPATDSTNDLPPVRTLRIINPSDIDTNVISFTTLHADALLSDRETFLELMEQWRTERPVAASSIAEIVACPSYLRIIAMGSRALPLIIEQLEREGNEPDHWCAALEAITGEDPVPEDAQGDSVRIARAWIAWNRTRNAWTFHTSTTLTIESPATELTDIIALPGLLNPV